MGIATATDVVARPAGLRGARRGGLVPVVPAGTPPRPVRFLLGTLSAPAAVPLLDLVGARELRLPGDGRAALGLLAPAGCGRSRFLVAVDAVSVLVTVVFPTRRRGALMAAGLLFAVLSRGPVTAADTG